MALQPVLIRLLCVAVFYKYSLELQAQPTNPTYFDATYDSCKLETGVCLDRSGNPAYNKKEVRDFTLALTVEDTKKNCLSRCISFIKENQYGQGCQISFISPAPICYVFTSFNVKGGDKNTDDVFCWPSQQCPPFLINNKIADSLKMFGSFPSPNSKMTSFESLQKLMKLIADNPILVSAKRMSSIAAITNKIDLIPDDPKLNKITENLMKTFSVMLDAEPSIIQESEKSARDILNKIQSISNVLQKKVSKTNEKVKIGMKNIALHVAKVKRQSLKVIAFMKSTNTLSLDFAAQNNAETLDALATIDIPETAFKSGNGDREVVQSEVYLKSSLFVEKDTLASSPVQSVIISFSLGYTVEHLADPIILTFKKISTLDSNVICGFWVFGEDGASGKWSNDGCRVLNESANGIVTCACDHLTNFALLLDVYQKGNNPISLRIVSQVGSVISLISLLIIVVTFLYFPNLRAKTINKILISLCLSLAFLLLLFLFGIGMSKARLSCQIIAVFLHYFIVASFTWMCISAIDYFRHIVMFTKMTHDNFFLRMSLAGWTVPLIIVLPGAIARPQELGDENICIPRGISAYYGLFLPVGIILGINFFVLISVIVKLIRRKQIGESKTTKESNKVKAFFTLTILFGLTWIFAIFAVKDAEFFFQLLFCIFNSLQGLFVLLFYIVTNKVVHRNVESFFRRKKLLSESSVPNTSSYPLASDSAMGDEGKTKGSETEEEHCHL